MRLRPTPYIQKEQSEPQYSKMLQHVETAGFRSLRQQGVLCTRLIRQHIPDLWNNYKRIYKSLILYQGHASDIPQS